MARIDLNTLSNWHAQLDRLQQEVHNARNKKNEPGWVDMSEILAAVDQSIRVADTLVVHMYDQINLSLEDSA